jgi:hypothetical protein
MAKAINWPQSLRQAVLDEDTHTLYSALRLGTLYYDNRFWVPDEVVDIRVNHLRVRQGVVVGDLACMSLETLSSATYAQLKPGMQSLPEVLLFLQTHYPEQPVTPQTLVTLVTYKNLPLCSENMDPTPSL